MKSPWYKNAIFYELYLRAFYDSNADGNGDLPGLIEKLDYLAELGVNCIWLLPIYPSPLKDDGYDISDYLNISSEFGTLEDFRALLTEAHRREMYVIMDLVLNHTSNQHPWFQAARENRASPYRDYYVWSDTDEKYSQARIIFLDTQDSNWTWDEKASQYYWHRFYASQPDLNFDNPKVQEEMLDIVRFWLETGIDGFRVDAVPYLYQRSGTNCENLPQTHVYLKRLRAFVDENYPGRVLLCEANQWPEDVRAYFGDGDEFHMGFHFPLMPRIFMSIKRSDKSPIVWSLEHTPPIPDDCQWCIFLRNHDELTLEMVSDAERQWMWDMYAPNPRMRLNLGIRRRLAPLLDNDRRKIELANSLLLSLPGTPIIYYGDEIGMGDDIWLPDRNGVRTPMQWENSPSAGYSTAAPTQFYSPIIRDEIFSPQRVNVADQIQNSDSLWHSIKRMISIRKSIPVFGSGQFRLCSSEFDEVFAYWRETSDHRVLVVNNLSPEERTLRMDMGIEVSGLDLLTNQKFQTVRAGELRIDLTPYGHHWIRIEGKGCE
jgi:maltose alpha-D-glucosyltransferase/alpha-amylase